MEHIREYMATRSRFVVFLSVSIITTFLGEYLLRGNPLVTLLALIPANSFLRRTFTWNIFTHLLIEADLFMGLLALVVLHSWGNAVVREWGAVEIGKILVGVNAIIGVLIIIFSAASHPSTMWVYEYHCGAAYTITAIVGVYAHLFPDLTVFPAFNELRARHTPLLLTIFLVMYDLVRKGPSPTDAEALAEVDVWRGHCSLYAPVAMWLTWLYIRQTKEYSSPLHDLFYPAPLRDLVKRIGASVAPVGKVLGCGGPMSAADRLASQHAQTMFQNQPMDMGAGTRYGRGASAVALSAAGGQGHHAAIAIPQASPSAVAVAHSSSLLVAAAGAGSGGDTYSSTKTGDVGGADLNTTRNNSRMNAGSARSGSALPLPQEGAGRRDDASAAAEVKKQLARSALAKRLAMGSASAVVGGPPLAAAPLRPPAGGVAGEVGVEIDTRGGSNTELNYRVHNEVPTLVEDRNEKTAATAASEAKTILNSPTTSGASSSMPTASVVHIMAAETQRSASSSTSQLVIPPKKRD